MKFIKWFFIVLAGLVGVVLIIGLVVPKEFQVTAETTIDKPAGEVFFFIATFTDRESWDPWLETDPECKVEIVPKEGYTGSTYNWDGDKIGTGRMEVDTAIFGKLITSSIWFGKSPKPSTIYWTFSESGGSTAVTWSMKSVTGNPFMRFMGLFMKKGLITSLDKGLSNLENLIMSKEIKISSLSTPGVKEIPGFTALTVTGKSEMAGISGILDEFFSAVMQTMQQQGLKPAGAPFAKYFDFEPETGVMKVTAGMAFTGEGTDTGVVKVTKIDNFKAVSAIHSGPYTEFAYSYKIIEEFMNENGYGSTGESYEFYLNDPMMVTDQAAWKTEIDFVIK